jgi:5-methylcytosine-specific restriction endonuclease McrA
MMCASSAHQWVKKLGKPNRNREFRRRLTRHHIIPRSRGGGNAKTNLFLLWNNRHEAWHTLFGNSTIDEAIAILNRIKRAKL